MSSQAEDTAIPAALHGRLGFLLKHAQLRLAEFTGAALEPYGISGRELAVLLVLADGEPGSQQQAARRLGVDRTTMVGLIDALEKNGLVSRRQAEDRRRNVVELTDAGRDTLGRATAASDEAQRRFLAPLGPAAAAQLAESLTELVSQPGG